MILLEYGNLLPDQNKFTEALEQYSKAMEIAPKSTECIFYIASCHERLKDFDSAQKMVLKALELEPKSHEYRYLYESYLMGYKKYKEAIELLHFIPQNGP